MTETMELQRQVRRWAQRYNRARRRARRVKVTCGACGRLRIEALALRETSTGLWVQLMDAQDGKRWSAQHAPGGDAVIRCDPRCGTAYPVSDAELVAVVLAALGSGLGYLVAGVDF